MRKRKEYTFREDLAKRLKDPEFKKAWEESEVEYNLMVELIEKRLKSKLSQRALAKKVGTSQAAISNIEGMNANPSLSFLKRIAKSLNSSLEIKFIGR